MDGRINNSGTIGNKGGGWPSIDRAAWTQLKNMAVKQVYDILTNPEVSEERKDKFRLKMLDKINDLGEELVGKLELVIKEHEPEPIQTDNMATNSSAE